MIIQLNAGYKVQIDDADWEKVKDYHWFYDHGYARAKDANKKNIYMHRLLMRLPAKGLHVDHRSGDKLDNRRTNLRLATELESQRNQPIYKNNKSGYKGVSKIGNRWRATIIVEKKQKALGCYGTPREAAKAYDEGAKLYFGEFARVNGVKT